MKRLKQELSAADYKQLKGVLWALRKTPSSLRDDESVFFAYWVLPTATFIDFLGDHGSSQRANKMNDFQSLRTVEGTKVSAMSAPASTGLSG